MSATTTSQAPCAGTTERCVTTCTNPCYNGQYATRVDYGNGHADYLTVNCGCNGQPCWLCIASEDCGDDYCDGTCRN